MKSRRYRSSSLSTYDEVGYQALSLLLFRLVFYIHYCHQPLLLFSSKFLRNKIVLFENPVNLVCPVIFY